MNNPERGRAVARAMGATRNKLFRKDGRMIRILEFPEGVRPRPFGELAAADPRLKAFLRQLGPLIEDGFDVNARESLEAFDRRITFTPAYDVRV